MDINPQKPDLLQEELSIVLNGDFNPIIFHPSWFAKNQLIRENEANDAVIEVIAPDVASFKLDWISFQILRDRFIAIIRADAYRDHLVDIVQNVFNILSHTPIKQLGINNTISTTFRSTSDWHAFGHFLVPKNQWAGILNTPGMRSMNVQGIREDKRPGFIVITTEPDLSIRGGNKVYIRVNDHYDNPDLHQGIPLDAKWAVDILGSNYQASMQNSFRMIESLTDNFVNTKSVDDGRTDAKLESAVQVDHGLFNYDSAIPVIQEPSKVNRTGGLLEVKEKNE